MSSHRTSPSWIPQAIVAAALALAAGGYLLDTFGLSTPGIGRAQLALLGLAAAVAVGGVALEVAQRRGMVRLPAPPLPADAPDDRGALLLAIWFGLIAGILDPLILHAQRWTGLRYIYINPHMSWLSPLSYAGFFLLFVLAVRLVARGRWSWLRSRRAMAALLLLLLLVSLLLLFHPELHLIAILVLAAGAAVQTFRMLARRGVRFASQVRRTLIPLIAVVLLLTGYHLGMPVVQESRRVAALPPARDGAPNVLLIILDTVRGASVSFNGYVRPTTPNLERRARRGVVFERAVATSSWSAPSHASLLTGTYPFDLPVAWLAPLDASHPTLSEELSADGYRSAGFVANKLFAGPHTGLARGAQHWDADFVSLAGLIGASQIGLMVLTPNRLASRTANQNRKSEKRAPHVTDEFLAWVRRDTERPFFALLNYFDAHDPHDHAPAEYLARVAGMPRPELPLTRFDPDSVASWLDHYDGTIALLDAELERLFRELEALGELDETIVIVTSDHGEQFGERGRIGHGNSLNWTSIHVPLLMFGPGVPEGQRVREIVSLRDVPATVLELTDVQVTSWPGESLLCPFPAGGAFEDGLVFSAVSNRAWVTDEGSERGNLLTALQGSLRYGRYGEAPAEELFDIAADPWEQNDLAGDPRYRDVMARFRAATDSIAASWMQRRADDRR